MRDIITHEPKCPERTYDLIGLTRDDMRLLHRALGRSTRTDDSEAGVTPGTGYALWLKIGAVRKVRDDDDR